jgi:hypothetical protein
MGTIVFLVLLGVMWFGLKLVWKAGFLAGKDHEAMYWLRAFSHIFIPNWQSLPIKPKEGEEMNPDQLKLANQMFVAAYALAVDRLMKDFVEARQEELRKAGLLDRPESQHE